MTKYILIAILFTTLEAFAFQKKGGAPEVTPLESVVQERLEMLNEHIAIHRVSPNNPKETIVVIPETVNETDDEYELNTHIFVIDNKTGKITNTYFESSETNGWTSDAIFIDNIAIDTTAYKLSPSKNAFGLIVTWRSMSRPNPYRQESISLYSKEKDSLKKVLDLFPIYESMGEVNVNGCYAKFNKKVNKLCVSNSLRDNYYDILIQNSTSEKVFHEDENGECNPKEKLISTDKKVLKFENGTYSKMEPFSKNFGMNKATTVQSKIDTVSLRGVKGYTEEPKNSIFEYYAIEKIDEVEIWSDKMFGRCCTEADLEYSELLEFAITAPTHNTKYPSKNLSDTRYRTAYVFQEHQNVAIHLKLVSTQEHQYHTYFKMDEVLQPSDTLLAPFKLSLVNGYVKSEKTFKENGRVKELQVFLNGIDQGTVTLLDTPLIQQFEMDFVFLRDDEVTLVPVSFYKGTKHDDICISEIQSSLSQIAHPSINKIYKVQELWKKGYAQKKSKE